MQPTPAAPRDFSGRSKDIVFTADGDTFYAVPRIATMLFTDLVARINATRNGAENEETQMEAVISFFDVALTDESAELMQTRLSDKKNPIDMGQALDIIGWLIEQYGGRPTPPSQSSSDGSATEATGTSSTDGAPSEVSIPLTSPLTDS
jgi:hypothetical protein